MGELDEEFIRGNGLMKDFAKLMGDPEDDFYDRISCAISVYILILFAVLTGGGLNFGRPVQCLHRPEAPEHWIEYYSDRCLAEGTYTTYTTEDPMLEGFEQPELVSELIGYYQWVPYVLALQAYLFLVPKIFWSFCLHFHSFDFISAICDASKLENLFENTGKKHLKELVRHVVRSSDLIRRHKGGLFGMSLSVCHLITKWLYVLNAVGQFFLLVVFVGRGDMMWGYDNFWRAFRLQQSPLFPLESYCTLAVKEGGVNEPTTTRTMQCVLPWNMINEKIYIFLWFWILFVFSMALVSAVVTTAFFALPPLRRHAIYALLQTAPMVGEDTFNKYAIHVFVTKIVRADGLLLLNLIRERSGDIIASQVAYEIWGHIMNEDADLTFEASSEVSNEEREDAVSEVEAAVVARKSQPPVEEGTPKKTKKKNIVYPNLSTSAKIENTDQEA
ncbi:hypothetical protein L596_026986 [Steinernema carpocapsae]|uniref:Innexin n=1 Tax=Steinernema carpocapsae TaxID=34508 RepID=A0A4U5M2Z3_STECR|nr:hypothetical protein L596_026986 [Steinernema carpocapsae]